MRRRPKRKIIGNKERPRLSVFRSSNNIHAQVIDDLAGKTLASASSLKMKKGSGNVDGAKAVGKELAKNAVAKGIKKVVFDRGKFKYHGRIKALADSAREGGLDF